MVDAAPQPPPPLQLPAFDCSTHPMHGVLHSNGYGHLARINGAHAAVPMSILGGNIAPEVFRAFCDGCRFCSRPLLAAIRIVHMPETLLQAVFHALLRCIVMIIRVHQSQAYALYAVSCTDVTLS